MIRLVLLSFLAIVITGCGCKKPNVVSIPPPKNEHSTYTPEPEKPTCLSEVLENITRIEDERRSYWHAREVLEWSTIDDWEIVNTKLCKVLSLRAGYILLSDGSVIRTDKPRERLFFSAATKIKLIEKYKSVLKQLEELKTNE